MPTVEEIRAERERRRNSARRQAAANGQPVSIEAIRAERARRQQPQARRVGPAEDVLRSFGTGIERGVSGLASMARAGADANDDLARRAAEALGRVMGASEEETRLGAGVLRSATDAFSPANAIARLGPSTQQIDQTIDRLVPGERHIPQTTAGEYAQTAGEFVPNAAFPGGVATRVARVVIPAAASETAGQATAGTPYEMPARIGGALIGGIATEAGVAANAARSARRAAQPEAQALEQEFGPLTAGERSGSPRARLEEDDLRRGIGSDQAQSIMRTHDARRAQTVRDSAMNVVTRGQPALSENLGEAGVILGDELRTARAASRARASQQYEAAFEAAKAEPIPRVLNDLPSNRIGAVAEEFGFEVPSGARTPIAILERQIQDGNATHANVERTRQALNRELGAAVNARNDAAEFQYGRVIDALDDWQQSILKNQNARRAMQEARGIYAETERLFGQRGRTDLSTGHTGRMDPGGRAIDRTINTDLTGEQIIDGILGTGTRPSQQALGAVQRIKELGTETIIYTNRSAESGVRVPGRQRVGGRTAGERRFAADDPNAPPSQQNPRGGMEQPTRVLQSLREGLWHRMLRPLDDYLSRVETSGTREGGILPAQRMVSQLDNALNKAGREIMAVLYTEREIAAMQRLLAYLKRIVPPPGASYSGTTPGLFRLISSAFDKAIGVIPGLGPVLREALAEANTTGAARRAVRPPPRNRPYTKTIDQPNRLAPPTAAVLALPPERRRRLGEDYP